MRKRTSNLVDKTYYLIGRGAFGLIKENNVKQVLLASEDIKDIEWYMEHVLHVKSEGIFDLNNATEEEMDFYMRLPNDKYYIEKAVMTFGRGHHNKTLIEDIKKGWKKIREYYK